MSVVECPDCGWTARYNGDAFAVIAAHKPHCTTTPRERETPMLQSVKNDSKRPPAAELARSDDKVIARAAQRVLDAAKRLDEVYAQRAETLALRAEIAEAEARVKALKAQLHGDAPKRDWKAIRAWAGANGLDCPTTGKVPNAVVDAYDADGGAA